MIGAMRSPAQQLVTVFGGSGFLGGFVVNALAKRGYRILVATRRPDLAYRLQPLGAVGQIHPVQANLRDAIRQAAGAYNIPGCSSSTRYSQFNGESLTIRFRVTCSRGGVTASETMRFRVRKL